MASTVQPEPAELVADVERMLDEVEALPESGGRETALALVQALLELYGAGLERIVAEIAARDDGTLAAALTGDELVAHLLLLHGLHPEPLEHRVLGALQEVRPYLNSHGGDVELLGIDGSAVRLALQGSCSGCPSSTMTLKLAIENAIHKAAPEVEEVVAVSPTSQPPLLQIEVVPDAADAAWTMVGGLRELTREATALKQVAGQDILFLKLEERPYAYRPECPGCGRSLTDGNLERTQLTCAGCGNRYDVLRAGRCIDAPKLYLEPVPLLAGSDGLVKIALPAAV